LRFKIFFEIGQACGRKWAVYWLPFGCHSAREEKERKMWGKGGGLVGGGKADKPRVVTFPFFSKKISNFRELKKSSLPRVVGFLPKSELDGPNEFKEVFAVWASKNAFGGELRQ
jgi:hypothetical protein